MQENANPLNRIHVVSEARRRRLEVAARLISGWQGTLRYKDADLLVPILRKPGGAVLLLWHNRIFPVLGAFRQFAGVDREIHALVSASRDGARLAYLLETLGIRTIRGSSSRRATTATREMLRVLAAGALVAVTVDGPRGPCYRAQPGAALLVQATGAPVFFLGAECEAAWTLPSWDRFVLPRPWSRVAIKKDHLPRSLRRQGRDQRKVIHQSIQDRLVNLTADRHFGDPGCAGVPRP
jgi:lysophospholipid acyltransferase (LPLAT)-like uncharacterized protein